MTRVTSAAVETPMPEVGTNLVVTLVVPTPHGAMRTTSSSPCVEYFGCFSLCEKPDDKLAPYGLVAASYKVIEQGATTITIYEDDVEIYRVSVGRGTSRLLLEEKKALNS